MGSSVEKILNVFMEKSQVIQLLNSCSLVSNLCYEACLDDKEISKMTRCIELARECADFCQYTSSIYSRESENAEKFLRLCAEICEDCADECEKHTNEKCIMCAKICRKCSEMCFSLQSVY